MYYVVLSGYPAGEIYHRFVGLTMSSNGQEALEKFNQELEEEKEYCYGEWLWGAHAYSFDDLNMAKAFADDHLLHGSWVIEK